MKKIIPISLGILLIINLTWLYLLKRDYESSQARIESSVLEEVDSRRQIEDSIRRDLDSKKQAKDFILQRDYEKALEELVSQVSDNQNLIEEYSRASRQQADELSRAVSQLSAALKAAREKLIQVMQDMEARKAADKEFDSRLDSSRKVIDERITRMEKMLQEQLSSFGRQLTEQAIRLGQLKDKLTGMAQENSGVSQAN